MVSESGIRCRVGLVAYTNAPALVHSTCLRKHLAKTEKNDGNYLKVGRGLEGKDPWRSL